MGENTNQNAGSFFDECGLTVATGDVEVGLTYPIYGMITKFLEIEGNKVTVEINFNILATMEIPDIDKIETLRSRAFEPGIFVSKVEKVDEKIEVSCGTVIFGKKMSYND